MKADINQEGQITISAETPLEAFALKSVTKKWVQKKDISESIIIQTGGDWDSKISGEPDLKTREQ